MTIAITGANGHTGNNICRMLLQKGYKVKALINNNDYALTNLKIEKIKGSLNNAAVLEKLVKDADYVIHTAAIISIGNAHEEKIYNINVNGTKNLVEACLKYPPKRFIHFSSIHALDVNAGNNFIDETTPLVTGKASVYDRSKAEAERIVLKAVKQHGLNAIILNPTSIVGPFDFEPSLLGTVIIKIARNRMPFIIKGGYNWVDVRDVAAAAINAFEKGRTGERYILSGEWRSLKEISKYISDAAGNRKPLIVPLFLAKIGLPVTTIISKLKNEPVLYTNVSLKIITEPPKPVLNDKAKKELDFNPRSVERCFKETVLWFKENNYI